MTYNNVVLDMVIATRDMPPRNVLCVKNGDGLVVCRIEDRAMGRPIAEFKVGEDLIPQIPQILNLYIK